jgi:hypothetical protein
MTKEQKKHSAAVIGIIAAIIAVFFLWWYLHRPLAGEVITAEDGTPLPGLGIGVPAHGANYTNYNVGGYKPEAIPILGAQSLGFPPDMTGGGGGGSGCCKPKCNVGWPLNPSLAAFRGLMYGG